MGRKESDEKVISGGIFSGLKKIQREKDFPKWCINTLPEILDGISIFMEAGVDDVKIEVDMSELVRMFENEGYEAGEYGEYGYDPYFYADAKETIICVEGEKQYIHPILNCLIEAAASKKPHKVLRDNLRVSLCEQDIVKKVFCSVVKQSDEYKRLERIAKKTYGVFYEFTKTCERLGIKVENHNLSTNIQDVLGVRGMEYRLIPDGKKMFFKTDGLSQTVFCVKTEKVIPGLFDDRLVPRSIKREHKVYGMFDEKPFTNTQKICKEGEKLLYDVAIISQRIGINDELSVEVCNDKIWLHSSFFKWELVPEIIDKLIDLENREVFDEKIITKEQLALIGPIYKRKLVKEDAFVTDILRTGVTTEEAHCLFMEYGNIVQEMKQKNIIESWSMEANGYSATFTPYGEEMLLSNRKQLKPDFSKHDSLAFIARRMPEDTMELILLLCSRNCKAYSKVIKNALINMDNKYLPMLELKIKRGLVEEELGTELYEFLIHLTS